MRVHGALHRRRYDLLTGALLALLLFRAYVPVGFMPATGTPFLLELCPAAISLAMPVHHHAGHDHAHDHAGHGHFDNCPFGSAPAAGPASELVLFQGTGPIAVPADVDFESARVLSRVSRAHPPRGPPALA